MTMSSQTVPFETSEVSLSPMARPVLVVLGIALLLSPIAINSGLIAFALLALIALVALTWRTQGPPVPLLICGFQWLQGSLMVFDAEVRGVELWTLSPARHIEQAVVLTLIWALTLALGMRFALRGVQVAPEVSLPSVRAALVIYLVWSLIVPLLALASPASAYQIIVALGTLRWAAVFVLFVCVLSARRGFTLLAIVFVIELGLGFLSFFSNFKTVLVVLTLALLASGRRFSLRQVIAFSFTFAFAVYLAILWTAVKGEYRRALNDGVGDQAVRIDTSGQAKALNRLVSEVDESRFDKAIDGFVSRITYVQYFAYAADYVPRVRPHEGGRLWWAAVEHIAMPRVLFPDKAPLPSDTEISERYTGMRLTHNRSTTSISLGLPAETYVDFGVPWMFIPGLLLGVLYGLTFRVLLTRRRYMPYGAGLMVSVGSPHMFLELSPTKALGSLLTLGIISVIVWFAVLPWLVPLATRLTSPPRTPGKPTPLRLT